MDGLTRGQLAAHSGVNIETVRYYEGRGLIPKARRTRANYRLYAPDAVRRVRFIRRAQELGFSLNEIHELLSLRAAPKASCGQVRRRAEEKLRDIDDKLRALRRMKRALGRLISECSGQGPLTDCPILDALDPEKEMP